MVFKLWNENKTQNKYAPDQLTDNEKRYDVTSSDEYYTGSLHAAMDHFSATHGISDDFVVRALNVGGRRGVLLFFETVSNDKVIENCVSALQNAKIPRNINKKQFIPYIMHNVLTSNRMQPHRLFLELDNSLSDGNAILLIEGITHALCIESKAVPHRTPTEPTVEASSRGAQVAFVEDLEVNLALIRQYFKTDTLEVKKIYIGIRSRTNVGVLFLSDVANPTSAQAVLNRIQNTFTDVLTQGASLENEIVDNRWTTFPLTRPTQRVDNVVKEITNGKIAIIIDGDPTVLLTPATLADHFQTIEDYSHSWAEGTFIRLLRFASFLLAVYLPALYISFADFNPELLPKVLGLKIAISREGVPFNAVTEVVLMQTVLEILREASMRMPKQMGQAISIVGGLVLGEASVQAGIVSNFVIIIIALSAISVFVTPSYEMALTVRLASWAMVLGAGFLGLYGVLLITMLILYHLSSLTSFGVAYTDRLSGEHIFDLFRDGLIRLPTSILYRRSRFTRPLDPIRKTYEPKANPRPTFKENRRKSNRRGWEQS